jgi:mannan endo-1,4-beta-mannosidase
VNPNDIYDTLANMSSNGIKVVRTWAFNDVNEIPTDNSTWFQLISPNGTVTVNEGPNGLQRLDTVVDAAEKLGMFIHFSLTNNWNPFSDTVKSTRRNVLSNDYGGMDAYIRANAAAENQNHDIFYTDEKIQELFTKWTTTIVSRYKDSPAIFAWEVANDPRCESTLPSTTDCTPQVVTRWHSKVAKHIKTVDPNHLVSSGSHGFFCVDCPKLFPRITAPAARPSARAVNFKRKAAVPLTRARLRQEKKRAWRVASEMSRAGMSGLSIRGRWSAPLSRRQSELDIGNAFDGAFGVDSEDIINIPEIGFGTFQLFPDQNSYGSTGVSIDAFNDTVNQGIEWIRRQGEAAALYGKPITLTGFGLVTQGNADKFVPFNSTTPLLSSSSFNSTNSTTTTDTPTSTVTASAAPTGTTTDSVIEVTGTTTDSVSPTTTSSADASTSTSTGSGSAAGTATARYGVTDDQRNDAYNRWVGASVEHGINGAIQYQWGQSSLTTSSSSPVSENQDSTGQSSNTEETGISPNDGYSQEIGESGSQTFFNSASQEIGTSSA